MLAGLFSYTTFAEPVPPAKPGNDSFQSVCINAWMEKADTAKDKVDYKNFGEKYCGCAASQPLDTDAAIQKAIQLCMSRTLLHDAMDSMEEAVGLPKASEADITNYCQDRWNLIYPEISDENKKKTIAYCDCAKPKLMDLVKQSDNITDKQYDDGINDIAAACSIDALADKPAAAPTSAPVPAPESAPVPAATPAPLPESAPRPAGTN